MALSSSTPPTDPLRFGTISPRSKLSHFNLELNAIRIKLCANDYLECFGDWKYIGKFQEKFTFHFSFDFPWLQLTLLKAQVWVVKYFKLFVKRISNSLSVSKTLFICTWSGPTFKSILSIWFLRKWHDSLFSYLIFVFMVIFLRHNHKIFFCLSFDGLAQAKARPKIWPVGHEFEQPGPD